MSENGRRDAGDGGGSARPNRRAQGGPRRDDKRSGERRGSAGHAGGRGGHSGHRDKSGTDRRSRDDTRGRGARPGSERDDRRRDDRRDGRGRDDRRGERRGDRRQDDRRREGRDRDERRTGAGGRSGDRNRDERRGDRTQRRPDRDRRDNRGRQSDRSRPRPERDDRAPRREDAPSTRKVPAPDLPASAEISNLDAEARRELRSLPKDLADRVGKHLAAAGLLVDHDPQFALAHARYAKSQASRIPVVREAVGLAAYHAGEWAEALSELRAVRRMTRVDTHVAVIADAERAMGRPERALDLAKEVRPGTLAKDVEIELRIVEAGARRDLGQLDAAVVTLQGPDLNPSHRQPWSHRLFYAYADNLVAAGRTPEAVRWFLHAAEADLEEETDAAERAAELSQ
ncbi:hypothetical protein [Saccharomonospora piscinae]|uniref:hypothetical protein n=1 Tax=Saccharomonospora piscinae TaxID=687388 RepID=UPI00207BC7FC|nr:hypothetical protein [Saccharomonospora piscinae]